MRLNNSIARTVRWGSVVWGSVVWGCTLIFLLGCGQAKDTPSASQKTADAPQKNDRPAPKKIGLDPTKIKFSGPAKVLSTTYAQWKIATEPRYFGPENLYDLINGGSEIFLAYGFKQIATQDYKNDAHPTVTITIEVYDMGTPLGAFGRVSKYLDNMASPGDAGKGLPAGMADKGILGDGDLLFWKDKYLVHLTLMDENPEATMESITTISNKTIPVIGKEIFDGIKDDKTKDAPIKMVAVFPAENRIERSQGYRYDFPAGADSIKAFTCRYKTDDTQWSIVVTEAYANGAAAAGGLKNVKKNENIVASRLVHNHVIGIVKDGESAPNDEIVQTQLQAVEAALSTIKK